MVLSPKKKITVCFDCDETLVINDRYGQNPSINTMVVTLFKVLEKLGCEMYIWSAGGKDWAEEVMNLCALDAEIIEKPSWREITDGNKDEWSFCPDIAVDDCEDCGRVTIFV